MSWLRRAVRAFRPSRVERDIDRELAFHVAERVDELRASGLSEADARRRAHGQFGMRALVAERTRQIDVAVWLEARLRDVRYAVRSLARTPAFGLTVVATLALGIGANTAVFSAIDAVLLRPLPFPDGDRLVQLEQKQERSIESKIAPVRLEDWQRLNVTFEAITGYYVEDVSETSGDVPERVRRALVTRRFLDVWGMAPAVGRGFADAEHSMSGPRAVLISHRYWTVRLGATPDVLSRVIRIGRAAFPIVGVMPATFLFPDRDVDVWFPTAVDAPFAQSRQLTWYTGIGRLKPGATVDAARANLAAVQTELGRQHPETDKAIGITLEPLKETAIGAVRRSLWLVYGAVTVLLLITCTNIAALLLSRAAHRQQEIAVRLSLGASQGTVMGQLLTETIVLSLAGALVGVGLASGLVTALRAAAPNLPRVDEIVVDSRILPYTLGSTLCVALLCGVLPALRASRDRLTGALTAARTQVSLNTHVQWALVGAQVALSVTLLAGAGLLVRSLYELSRVDAGFTASRVLSFRISGDYNETVAYDRLIARIDRSIERLRALPGVEAAATTIFLPGLPTEYERRFDLVEAQGETDRGLVAENRFVSPGYFATLQIPVVDGALCAQQPFRAEQSVMVNRSFVTRYLSGRASPVGLHLAPEGPAPRGRIAGVVADAHERGLDRTPGPMVYTCFSAPNPTPYFVVRTRDDAPQLAQTVRLAIKELEPLRSVYDIAPLEDRIAGAFTENRLRTWLLALFALTALTLACVGVYGTLSYVVSQRRREVGLRLALGAARSGIVRQFLLQGVRVAAIASIAGLALSIAFSRVLRGMLFGVSTGDPLVFAAVLTIVLSIAAIAALVPSVRAARVEPMQVLRDS